MSKQDTATGNTAQLNWCWYYLHSNGELIRKTKNSTTAEDFDESPFVRKYWKVDLDNRADVYYFLIAASMEGARPERIQELVRAWSIDFDDAQIYCKNAGLEWRPDGDHFFVYAPGFLNLQESHSGCGKTLFEAVVDFYAAEVVR